VSATFQSSLETYKLEENYVDEKKEEEDSENEEYSETEKLRDREFGYACCCYSEAESIDTSYYLHYDVPYSV